MMKTKFGKVLSIFLCFTMLFTSFPITFSNRLGNESYESFRSEKDDKKLESLEDLEKSKIEYESLANNFSFIPNTGKYDESVLWYGSFGINMVFVDDTNTITYLLPDENTTENLKDDIFYSEESNFDDEDKPFKAWVLKEQFLNSKSITIKKGIKQVNGNFNFISGNKSKGAISNVQLYEDINFSNIYPNIDLILSHKGEAIEKIFKIDKGGKPDNIDINIDGALSLEVNDFGELVVKTNNQSYTFSKPIAWQGDNKEKEVKVEYWVNGTEYGFNVGDYNKNETLYIDPEIVSTYLGGLTTYTSINDITTDAEGNIYVAGSVKYNSYPVTAGAYDTTFNGADDGIISKFNNNLTQILASTFISGSGYTDDSAVRVRIDDEKNIVVGLETKSSDFPVTQFAYDKTYNGSKDVALTIFSNDLSTLKYATFIGGSGNESFRDLQFDQGGNIVFGGTSTYSTTNYPTTAGVYQTSNKGGADAFVSIISKDLSTLISSTLLGVGIKYDYLNRIVIRSNGDIVIAGCTENEGFPTTTNAYDRTYNGGLTDMYLAIFNSNLTSLKASTLLGGNNGTTFELPSGLNILPDGNIVVTGYTQAANFPVTMGLSTRVITDLAME